MLYDLKRVPAFGFESKNIRAKTIADLEAEKTMKKVKTLPPCRLKKQFERGIQKYGSETNFRDHLSLSQYECHNQSKIGGYFPGIGTLYGLRKIYKAINYKKNDYEKKFLIRGVIETLSLGFLLLPIDLWATQQRKHKWKKLQAASFS